MTPTGNYYLDRSYSYFTELVSNSENVVNRLWHATFPIFNSDDLFGQCSALVGQGLLVGPVVHKTYANGDAFIKSCALNGLSMDALSKAALTMVGIAQVVITLANYQFGLILLTGSDIGFSLHHAYLNLMKGDYGRAGAEFYIAITHGVRFATLIYPTGVELQIASTALQIILEVGKCCFESKSERYLETLSYLSLVRARSYKVLPQHETANENVNQSSVITR
jgi:hypothetical protein